MTSTVTITQTAEPSSSISLAFKMPGLDEIKKRLAVIVCDILESSAFPDEIKALIKAWDSHYFSKYLIDLKTEENRLKASRGLCFFLYEFIYKGIAIYNNDASKRSQICVFEERLIVILKLILPHDKDVEVFLETCENGIDARNRFQTKLGTITEIFQKQMEQLDNLTDDSFAEKFEKMRSKLLNLITSRKTQGKEMQIILNRLKDLVDEVSKAIQEDSKKIGEAGQAIQNYKSRFLSLLDSTKKIMGAA